VLLVVGAFRATVIVSYAEAGESVFSWNAPEVLSVRRGRMSPAGRVTIPALWLRRNDPADGFIIAKGHRRVLDVWTTASLERYIRYRRHTDTSETMGWLARLPHYVIGDEVVGVDSRGRFHVPLSHREHALLTSDVVWLEFAHRIALCDAQQWRLISERPTVCRNPACAATNDAGRRWCAACGRDL
jgi:DNA-binding transcriptional regulator/RsmH inhibitor MraZ